MGVRAAEDGHLGRLKADRVDKVFLFLCDCFPQKLNFAVVRKKIVRKKIVKVNSKYSK